VVRELGSYLGEACAMLIDLLNPQRISLGSLALRLGGLLVDAVKESARKEALGPAFEACEIAPAALGDRAQDLAALAVACTVLEAGGKA
jgi:glucokinase